MTQIGSRILCSSTRGINYRSHKLNLIQHNLWSNYHVQGLPLRRRRGLSNRSVLDDLNWRKGNKTRVIRLDLTTIFLGFPTLLKTLHSKDLTSKLFCLPNWLTPLTHYVILSPKHGLLLRIKKKIKNQVSNQSSVWFGFYVGIV